MPHAVVLGVAARPQEAVFPPVLVDVRDERACAVGQGVCLGQLEQFPSQCALRLVLMRANLDLQPAGVPVHARHAGFGQPHDFFTTQGQQLPVDFTWNPACIQPFQILGGDRGVRVGGAQEVGHAREIGGAAPTQLQVWEAGPWGRGGGFHARVQHGADGGRIGQLAEGKKNPSPWGRGRESRSGGRVTCKAAKQKGSPRPPAPRRGR